MDTNTKAGLSSSEIASLWETYMADSMALCMLEYFLNKVNDEESRAVMQLAYDFSLLNSNGS